MRDRSQVYTDQNPNSKSTTPTPDLSEEPTTNTRFLRRTNHQTSNFLEEPNTKLPNSWKNQTPAPDFSEEKDMEIKLYNNVKHLLQVADILTVFQNCISVLTYKVYNWVCEMLHENTSIKPGHETAYTLGEL